MREQRHFWLRTQSPPVVNRIIRISIGYCAHSASRGERKMPDRPVVRDRQPGDVADHERADLDVPDHVRRQEREVRREVVRAEEIPAAAPRIRDQLVARPRPGRPAARSSARSRRRARSGSGCRRTPVPGPFARRSPRCRRSRAGTRGRRTARRRAARRRSSAARRGRRGSGRSIRSTWTLYQLKEYLYCQMLVRLKPSKNVVPSITATNGDRPRRRVPDREAGERDAHVEVAVLTPAERADPREELEVDREAVAVREPRLRRRRAPRPNQVIAL